MTYEEAEALAALVSEWTDPNSPWGIELACGGSVAGELAEVDHDHDAYEIRIVPHYEMNQWKLTRHDACYTVGWETLDQGGFESHARCTVIGQSG